MYVHLSFERKQQNLQLLYLRVKTYEGSRAFAGKSESSYVHCKLLKKLVPDLDGSPESIAVQDRMQIH